MPDFGRFETSQGVSEASASIQNYTTSRLFRHIVYAVVVTALEEALYLVLQNHPTVTKSLHFVSSLFAFSIRVSSLTARRVGSINIHNFKYNFNINRCTGIHLFGLLASISYK